MDIFNNHFASGGHLFDFIASENSDSTSSQVAENNTFPDTHSSFQPLDVYSMY